MKEHLERHEAGVIARLELERCEARRRTARATISQTAPSTPSLSHLREPLPHTPPLSPTLSPSPISHLRSLFQTASHTNAPRATAPLATAPRATAPLATAPLATAPLTAPLLPSLKSYAAPSAPPSPCRYNTEELHLKKLALVRESATKRDGLASVHAHTEILQQTRDITLREAEHAEQLRRLHSQLDAARAEAAASAAKLEASQAEASLAAAASEVFAAAAEADAPALNEAVEARHVAEAKAAEEAAARAAAQAAQAAAEAAQADAEAAQADAEADAEEARAALTKAEAALAAAAEEAKATAVEMADLQAQLEASMARQSRPTDAEPTQPSASKDRPAALGATDENAPAPGSSGLGWASARSARSGRWSFGGGSPGLEDVTNASDIDVAVDSPKKRSFALRAAGTRRGSTLATAAAAPAAAPAAEYSIRLSSEGTEGEAVVKEKLVKPSKLKQLKQGLFRHKAKEPVSVEVCAEGSAAEHADASADAWGAWKAEPTPVARRTRGASKNHH